MQYIINVPWLVEFHWKRNNIKLIDLEYVCGRVTYFTDIHLWLCLAVINFVSHVRHFHRHAAGCLQPLCCPFFFDIRILITPLACSNSY